MLFLSYLLLNLHMSTFRIIYKYFCNNVFHTYEILHIIVMYFTYKYIRMYVFLIIYMEDMIKISY